MDMVEFLGLEFTRAPLATWLERLTSPSSDRAFTYIVTPNVDHIVTYASGQMPRGAYDNASYRICDSRILALLARLRGLSLPALPGSDLVKAILDDPRARSLKIATFGPSLAQTRALERRYPTLTFLPIPAAERLVPGSPAWHRAVAEITATEFDLLLCCISFPKQEQLCHEVQNTNRAHGIGLCAGASLDFLTGKQTRAPRWMQRAGLEWAFRLGSAPRRMFARYVIRGPRILLLTLRWRRRAKS